MMPTARTIVAAFSAAIVVIAMAIAIVLGPAQLRIWLVLAALLALATTVQSLAADPADLAPALAFAILPVLSLVASGSPSWLIAPLGVLLLVAGELNALSWEMPADGSMISLRRRLMRTARLGVLGLAASLVVVILT